MGMFDYVKYGCICPVCKNKVDGFQSKDGECALDLVSVSDVDNFYTHCQCGVWIEFNRVNKVDFKRTVAGEGHDFMKVYDKIISI